MVRLPPQCPKSSDLRLKIVCWTRVNSVIALLEVGVLLKDQISERLSSRQGRLGPISSWAGPLPEQCARVVLQFVVERERADRG
jgi:hypothetical protein